MGYFQPLSVDSEKQFARGSVLPTFVSKHYSAYEGRNPRTGEVIRVGEKHLPFFKVGKDLRERVDGKHS